MIDLNLHLDDTVKYPEYPKGDFTPQISLHEGDEVLVILAQRPPCGSAKRAKAWLVLACFGAAFAFSAQALIQAEPANVPLAACIMLLCGASVLESL